ncbi:MAG: hypothetical protein GY898_24840 [Proteobacteria bacterium]|nr:hypothetical protein [Pseudomonadota bacterium]
MSDVLNATEVVVENWRRARTFGRRQLWLVVSAENCDGCDTLARQLADPELREGLSDQAYIAKIVAGDLRGSVASSLQIGSWTLESPGFPTTWVWTVSDDGLAFDAVAIGPLDDMRPDVDADGLLAGRSAWVHEAGGVTLQACSGSLCLPLNRGAEFRAEFSIPLHGE